MVSFFTLCAGALELIRQTLRFRYASLSTVLCCFARPLDDPFDVKASE